MTHYAILCEISLYANNDDGSNSRIPFMTTKVESLPFLVATNKNQFESQIGGISWLILLNYFKYEQDLSQSQTNSTIDSNSVYWIGIKRMFQYFVQSQLTTPLDDTRNVDDFSTLHRYELTHSRCILTDIVRLQMSTIG